MTGEPWASRGAIWAALTAAVALGVWPDLAGAQGLRRGLLKKPPGVGRTQEGPPVARYISEDGDVFILDRSQPTPLLKFEDSPEVWVLSPQPAPRGDVIYKNDLGEPVLRATRLGGVTLFTDHRPGGEAASLAGPGAPLRLQILNAAALLERLGHASLRSGRAARHGVPFEGEASPASAAVMGDAAVVTSLAFLRLAERDGGESNLAGIRKVRLVEGKKPSVTLAGGVLLITVAPTQGLAGRPSSHRIEKVLLRGADTLRRAN